MVAILASSVNCVCVCLTKKVNYVSLLCCRKLTIRRRPQVYQCTSSGISMHELPRNRPAVRQKWIKFKQFKQADFLAAPHHAHLCSKHFIEYDFANPLEYHMGFCFEADTMFRYSFKILPDRLKLIRLYPCGSLGHNVSFVFGA